MESQSGDSVVAPLEAYWKEFHTFEEGGAPEDDEEDFSKTPDEGEIEEEWLRDAGFQNLVDSELTEAEEEEFLEDILATLTARQIVIVKRRLDTVRKSKNKRLPRQRHRADVRHLFGDSTTVPSLLATDGTEPLSIHSLEPGRLSPPLRAAKEPLSSLPSKLNSRTLPTFSFLSHSGGFSLGDRSRGGIDCESPTSVEVLKYESRKSTLQERLSFTPSDPYSLETGFQEISTKINFVNDLTDFNPSSSPPSAKMSDLGELDRNLVRSLAIIEVAALFDTHGVFPLRRKTYRKKRKDKVVFGASLTSLLELDHGRCPGIKVPLIFQWILHHLQTYGLREEGLLRLGGSMQKIQLLKSEIEENYIKSPGTLENLIRQSSVHDASVLLKQLVRHLPEPLLTNSHMDSFKQVPRIPLLQDQLNALNLLVLALPDGNREVLEELMHLLRRIVEEEPVNRMSLENVAMIMAPNLFPPQKKNPSKSSDLATEMANAAVTSKVTQMLIRFSKRLGAVPAELLVQARLQNSVTKNKLAKRIGKKEKREKQKNQTQESSANHVQVPFSFRHPATKEGSSGEVLETVAKAFGDVHCPVAHQQESAFLQRSR